MKTSLQVCKWRFMHVGHFIIRCILQLIITTIYLYPRMLSSLQCNITLCNPIRLCLLFIIAIFAASSKFAKPLAKVLHCSSLCGNGCGLFSLVCLGQLLRIQLHPYTYFVIEDMLLIETLDIVCTQFYTAKGRFLWNRSDISVSQRAHCCCRDNERTVQPVPWRGGS